MAVLFIVGQLPLQMHWLSVVDPGYPRRGHQPISWSIFRENCMKMKIFWTRGGCSRSLRSLDPPMIMFIINLSQLKIDIPLFSRLQYLILNPTCEIFSSPTLLRTQTERHTGNGSQWPTDSRVQHISVLFSFFQFVAFIIYHFIFHSI